MSTLHFIYGKPGAGKTTLARRLAESERAVAFIEDEWLHTLGAKVTSVDDYLAWTTKLRAVIGPLATRLLSLGVNVVFDFAGNTVRGRAWVRSVFEAAKADHALHVLEVSDEEAKRRVRERNATRPAGVWFGDVDEALVDAVVKHIVPPSSDEGFRLQTDSAARESR